MASKYLILYKKKSKLKSWPNKFNIGRSFRGQFTGFHVSSNGQCKSEAPITCVRVKRLLGQCIGEKSWACDSCYYCTKLLLLFFFFLLLLGIFYILKIEAKSKSITFRFYHDFFLKTKYISVLLWKKIIKRKSSFSRWWWKILFSQIFLILRDYHIFFCSHISSIS